MVFITENWFWRGTQSAIFYYAACTPWVEYKRKRKRRREANVSTKKRNEIIAQQPGTIPQPAPFETNESWAEEILKGPHPPKGWKKDPVYYKYAKKRKATLDGVDCKRVDTASTSTIPGKNDLEALANLPATPQTPTTPQGQLAFVRDAISTEFPLCAVESHTQNPLPQDNRRLRSMSDATVAISHDSPGLSSTAVDSRPSTSVADIRNLQSASSNESDSAKSKRASFESLSLSQPKAQTPRPSMDRRLSTAVDTFKDAVRTTLHPDKWNWIRYERDDEILSNLNDKVRSMWGNVIGQSSSTGEDREMKLKRVDSNDQVKKWQRGTHPAINELHPPVVSQLPYTPEEAKWMLLPPPSADVMMGRSRPDPFDDFNRKPLSVIGQRQEVDAPENIDKIHAVSSDEETPGSSDAEEDSSDEEWYNRTPHIQKPQRAHLWKNSISSEP